MKVTFPHMGNMNISIKSLFENVGLDVLEPPPITKKTLDLGVKYSPEFACLPLKINVGNYIEALEAGADTIIMGGGIGPCRFGYYAEVQKEILTDLEYDYEMIVLEPFQSRWQNFIKQFKFIFKHVSWWKIMQAWKISWDKCQVIDEAAQYRNKMRAYALQPELVTKIHKEFLNNVDQAKNIENLYQNLVDFKNKVLNLELDFSRKPLKVGIVGEIYVVLEPFTNLNIEEKLGKMGVIVDRSIHLSDWVSEHLFSHLSEAEEEQRIKEAAEPYLKHFVGGHGLETIGKTAIYAEDGYDGVIQLAPFTCMPEIVAQSIIPEISRNEKIPVLSLILDEHTGDAGFITRLEAFVDLLARKKGDEVGGQVI
ncbi:2-hydroxyacyl-CoA dehydratase [Selenihalanaerobacter shriftii]|uniref:Predicted nucleotide-binding protein, sugar kinase/HSP70/actin superfamily n=1 Tax=Selenihalanaerobacter shriftii TaxID=142842 RepID=A0A1T4M6S5_9FIRM|nr:2-hydroxyacyl-CoA dehydratase [Selenihalanaerobacter shriftii]SJZ62605.1 Predicted nucleotide-binding protein, sugar kinase/HSP70/actin superfamily [Selenihalanaerobacter shriftii]